MRRDDLQSAPKLFADTIKVGYTDEFFVFGIGSGDQAQVYAITPAHAKRLQQYLTYELKTFEEKYGEIPAKWDPSVVSPLQPHRKPNNKK